MTTTAKVPIEVGIEFMEVHMPQNLGKVEHEMVPGQVHYHQDGESGQVKPAVNQSFKAPEGTGEEVCSKRTTIKVDKPVGDFVHNEVDSAKEVVCSQLTTTKVYNLVKYVVHRQVPVLRPVVQESGSWVKTPTTKMDLPVFEGVLAQNKVSDKKEEPPGQSQSALKTANQASQPESSSRIKN